MGRADLLDEPPQLLVRGSRVIRGRAAAGEQRQDAGIIKYEDVLRRRLSVYIVVQLACGRTRDAVRRRTIVGPCVARDVPGKECRRQPESEHGADGVCRDRPDRGDPDSRVVDEEGQDGNQEAAHLVPHAPQHERG